MSQQKNEKKFNISKKLLILPSSIPVGKFQWRSTWTETGNIITVRSPTPGKYPWHLLHSTMLIIFDNMDKGEYGNHSWALLTLHQPTHLGKYLWATSILPWELDFGMKAFFNQTMSIREGSQKKRSNLGFWLNLVRPPPSPKTWALLSGQFLYGFL